MPELWGTPIPRRELMRRIGGLEQLAGVRLVTLSDGAERGVRVLEFRTGTGFAFDVLVDRAMDIGRCELAGRAIGWESGVGFVGPWHFEPEGLGWLRSFGGGLLATGGLEHALFMAEDTAAQYHYPAKETEEFGLHGRISNRPAKLTGYGARWDGDDCTLWAEGDVLQAAVFGEHLLLRRRIEARVGASCLTIHDVVENVGWDPTPHMFLYHVNIGFPVVDEGAEMLVPISDVQTRSGKPAGDYRRLDAPAPAFVEDAFVHQVIPEADGRVPVGIVNRARGIGAYEVFNHQQLPVHFAWRMLGEGTYVVGLEPSTNRPEGRLDARQHGELAMLAPGETRTYDLELGALQGADEIDHFASRVNTLGGR
ncbi:MAG TPA: aldose 1-epimerase family protein [Thermomicrobiales bacterium]|nr:aldose 1-epimerase family protein [Thermomicrobiales bacterium]